MLIEKGTKSLHPDLEKSEMEIRAVPLLVEESKLGVSSSQLVLKDEWTKIKVVNSLQQ